MSRRLPVEPIFDQTPHLFADGPPDPVVYDASERALRQRSVNFAAKRYVDMMFVSGLDRATADRHFRPRAATVPAGLSGRPEGLALQAPLLEAHKSGRLVVETDTSARRVTVTWTDPAFGEPVKGNAAAFPGYGGIVLGEHLAPKFEPRSIVRQTGDAGRAWPIGNAVEKPPAAMAAALDAFFAS